MNRDDTKAKEDGSSSVVGDEMVMGSFSGDEANPRIIDKSVAPGTDQSPRDANESEENASGKGEEEESSKKNEGEESREVDEGEKEKEGGDEGEKEKEVGDEGEKEKEVGDEIEPRRNDEEADERAIIPSRQHETESHADSIEGPTNPIGGPTNNAQSGQAHADSVEATGATPGAEALKAMEGRLMNAVRDAVRDAMKGVKEKVTSLSTQLGLLEEEVKILRLSVPGSDNPAVQDDGDGSDNSESEEEDGDVGGDKKSEEEDVDVGGDKESEEEDGGDNNEPDEEDGSDNDVEDTILDISKDVQREYGDVDMDDDDAEMYAHAVEAEKKIKTKAAESVNTKKMRSRKDDDKEAVPVKKVKVDRGDNVKNPIQLRSRAAEEKTAEKRTRGAKKQKAAAEKKAVAAAKKKAAAEKEATAENEAAVEKEEAKKKAAAKKKQKKPKTKKVDIPFFSDLRNYLQTSVFIRGNLTFIFPCGPSVNRPTVYGLWLRNRKLGLESCLRSLWAVFRLDTFITISFDKERTLRGFYREVWLMSQNGRKA
ncbi:hypothetical protein IGI04_002418 [Brassica rapa subsp. trilocularis]|uniref:Uncharacterized protein n=1 Tax=Brassica rapa subsp. trilocularis TaxID=1813537 RepID=A0ABQ7NWB0_BRACM|nr:hypothetical protein IGI04_002418 [Brassica rapa subsp. trilocularis]